MLSVPTGPSACWQLPTELAPAGGASIIPEPSRGGGPGVGGLRDPWGLGPARVWEARDSGWCAGGTGATGPGTGRRPLAVRPAARLGCSLAPHLWPWRPHLRWSIPRAETQLHIRGPPRSWAPGALAGTGMAAGHGAEGPSTAWTQTGVASGIRCPRAAGPPGWGQRLSLLTFWGGARVRLINL